MSLGPPGDCPSVRNAKPDCSFTIHEFQRDLECLHSNQYRSRSNVLGSLRSYYCSWRLDLSWVTLHMKPLASSWVGGLVDIGTAADHDNFVASKGRRCCFLLSIAS